MNKVQEAMERLIAVIEKRDRELTALFPSLRFTHDYDGLRQLAVEIDTLLVARETETS